MPEESKEDLAKKYETPRKAAQITLARVKNWQNLNAENQEEGDKKFVDLTRKLWKEFTVHGFSGVEKKTGKKFLSNTADLDGRTSLGLLRLAGIKIDDIKYVVPGEFESGKINIDTGNKHGVVIEDEGKTAFFDHHGNNSGGETSATKITYEVLTSLGLLEKNEALEKMVVFVTQVDNRSFPNEEKYFIDSYQTLLGLQRFVNFENLLIFFKEGKNPADVLSYHELKRFGLYNQSESQKRVVVDSWESLERIKKSGFIVDSKRYGEIVVDLNKKVIAGYDAARGYGCGAYIIWAPEKNSFFISTVNPLTDEFSQGKKVRENMWIKPKHDPEPLRLTLKEVLDKMTDGKLEPTKGLKIFLDKEK